VIPRDTFTAEEYIMNSIRFITLCTCLIMAGWAHAQRTEIEVHHGTVRARLDDRQLDIEAGRKVTVLPGGQPTLAVSNPLVDDALTLVRLIQREKESRAQAFDSVLAIAIDMTVSDSQSSTVALFAEIPNPYRKKTDTVTLGPIVRVDNFEVYDTDGNRLQVAVLPSDTPDHAYYTVQFKVPCQADARMQLIVVATLDKIPYRPGGSDGVWKKGPLWHFFLQFSIPNSLHYYRIMLPDSAILVDSTLEPIALDTHQGRSVVTLRQDTGPHNDSKFTLAFLYPDHDQTTLADLPACYLGQLAHDERSHRQRYQTELNRIRAGHRYQDQSTPIAALLSLCSAAHHDDITAYGQTKEVIGPHDRKKAKLESVRYWIDTYDSIRTPSWPNHPGDGYIHPIYLRRSGTELPEIKQPMIFKEQKWYARPSVNVISNMAHEGSEESPDETLLTRLHAEGFITDWEVAGPYAQAGLKADALFNRPFGPELGDVDVPWRPIPVEAYTLYERDHAYVNLHKYLDGGPRRVAYLRTTLHASRDQVQRLDIRSDDGVKVWLNGKPVHAHNTLRGVDIGPDIVTLALQKGRNELLVKVIQDLWGWGLVAQLGSNKAVAPRPTGRAWNPNIAAALTWTPATQAQSHRIYFGTHKHRLALLDEVDRVAALKPVPLEPGTHYYWRVDEVLADGTLIPGDSWDFATGRPVGHWPMDGSAENSIDPSLHGRLHSKVPWGQGIHNQALHLNRAEDYVTLPPMHLNTDTLTLTLWVRTEKSVENPGLFFTRDGSTCAGLWLTGKNQLRYCWNNEPATWAWDSGLTVAHRQWTFVAMVVDLFGVELYLHDGRRMHTAHHDHGHGPARFDGKTWIGHDPRWSTLIGAIDDVRLFTYALGAEEIEAIYQEVNPR
jgi:hypothetical protein